MNRTKKPKPIVFHQDTRALAVFYGIVLISTALFFYAIDIKNPRQIIFNNIILGLIWAVMGIYNGQKLQKIYVKPFWQLQVREQKYIAISWIIAAFGIFMVAWKAMQWLR
ncbi:MAG: hypothetical protein MUE85_19045 [Microscillaceae bacterium]|jgi:uncharacterized membrane protein (UPF0182 family)|nr:hypothetical protein [Microscillaceae bacterium]